MLMLSKKITSYSVLSSEYGAYEQSISNKTASKARNKTESDESSENSDSSEDAIFGRTTLAKKKASGKPKKVMDALFHIRWWRIVLGSSSNLRDEH